MRVARNGNGMVGWLVVFGLAFGIVYICLIVFVCFDFK